MQRTSETTTYPGPLLRIGAPQLVLVVFIVALTRVLIDSGEHETGGEARHAATPTKHFCNGTTLRDTGTQIILHILIGAYACRVCQGARRLRNDGYKTVTLSWRQNDRAQGNNIGDTP